MKRNYDNKTLNDEMRTVRYNTNLDEKENYERWLHKAQDFLETYTKEVWVNTGKKNKEDSQSETLRKQTRNIEEKIRNETDKEVKYNLIGEKRKLKNQIKTIYEDKVLKEIRKNAQEIQEAGIRSAKFWATIRKIKNRNRQTHQDRFVINNNGDRVEEKEIAMKYIENFYSTLYEVGKMNPEYQKWTRDLIEDNKESRKNIEKKIKLGIEDPNIPDDYQESYPFTLEDINKAISALKNRKATGPDGITNEFLKALTRAIKDT